MSFIFRKPSRPVTRVFLHCSASDNPEHDNVATMDAWHKEKGWNGVGYHFFIRKIGQLETGRNIELTPAAQEGNNTGTIAICLHGLKVEKFTQAQFATLKELCRQIYAAYGGNITFHGHCEVARKACPVFDYRAVLGLDAKGRLGALATATSAPGPKIEMPVVEFGHIEDPGNSALGVLRLGSKSGAVEILQKNLVKLGYFVGKIDGDFGTRTRDAVMAFQADHHLSPDGKVGPLEREALRAPTARPVSEARSFASLSSLASDGSKIADAAIGMRAAGTLLSAGGLLSLLDNVTGFVSQLQKSIGVVSEATASLNVYQGATIGAIGLYVVFKSWVAGRAHVADYRSGKTA